MSVVRVAVPVYRGKRRFHLLKGRPWSPVEHLLLQALANGPRSADKLAEQSTLPKRLVIEALIRLMRADWVAVTQSASGTIFHATADGKSKAQLDELPNFPQRLTRWMTFVIDRVTGATFRRAELSIFERHVIEERAKTEPIVWVTPSPKIVGAELSSIFSALLDDDEMVVDVDPAGDRLVERYALILVRNGSPEKIPKSAVELEAVAKAAAAEHQVSSGDCQRSTLSSTYEPKQIESSAPKTKQIAFQSGDVVLGGEAHKTALVNAIKRARDWVIIHSTFISESSMEFVLPLLKDAARRGVKTDLLWGQNEDKPDIAKTMKLVSALREDLQSTGFDIFITLHPFSTNSHSKIIVSDDGQTGRFSAIVGSCNWLWSGFESFEASVRLRDSEMVADVTDVLVELSRGSNGLWKPLSTGLATLARNVRRQPLISGSRAEACIVLGAQHGHFVRVARDTAQRRILVTSHRLSNVANQSVIIPAIAAATSKSNVKAQVYFNRTSGPMTGGAAAELTIQSGKSGVTIRPVRDPRLHAKILAWDDDEILITSQNWLSSDPSLDNSLNEVGVYIKGTRIADNAIQTFLNARRS